MSFLQPSFLWALPLALLPVLIHLIHLHRRRTVAWAATRFLLAARKLNRGYSRLRRLLILSLRVLAVAALIGVICRPLAGGLLGLTGGTPDTVLILLDRSASMEQQNLATGLSKREAGLAKLTSALEEAYRGRSRLVLIDSATTTPQTFDRGSDLADLPATWPTDTTADLPALLQVALDYISTNQTGRSDIWILSDLQAGDWDASSGRWEALRSGFAASQGLRFHLLSYPEPAPDNLSLWVDRLRLRQSGEQAELVLDMNITSTASVTTAASASAREIPLRFLVNGVASIYQARLEDEGRLSIRGHSIALGPETIRGWGRVELPADSHPADNVWHFVFDNPPLMRSAIITDDPAGIAPVATALEAPADPSRNYRVDILSSDRIAEIAWEETALIVWQTHLPKPASAAHRRLLAHLAAGRSLLFLPPERSSESEAFLGVSWGTRKSSPDSEPERISWWRSASGLLANTRSGRPLPVGDIEISNRLTLEVENQSTILPLARVASDNSPLILSALTPNGSFDQGEVTFLGTPVGSGGSSLARDGVVLYALLHRSLDAGAASLGTARLRSAGQGSLGLSPDLWSHAPASIDPASPLVPGQHRALKAGVLSSNATANSPDPGGAAMLTALNRPPAEDEALYLDATTLAELFQGLDHKIITDSVTDDSALASEVWRTFLLLMAAALLIETILSLPPRGPIPVRATD